MGIRSTWGPVYVLLAAFALASAANADGGVSVELEARKVLVLEDGTEQLEPTDTVEPGDVLEYRATYTNRRAAAVRQLQPLLPIPAETQYLVSSARPQVVEASLDGERFAPVPLMRKVTREDGSAAWEAVPTSEYRYLRWHLGDLGPDQSVSVSARVAIPAAAAAPTR